MVMTFDTLKKKLLSMGGRMVAGSFEEDLQKMLVRGEVFSPKKVKSVKMKACRCHGNSGVFWKNYSDKNGFDNVQIVTGWCLSTDDIWRQHSFIYMPMDDVIIETTVKRKIYFGFALDLKESEVFHETNY